MTQRRCATRPANPAAKMAVAAVITAAGALAMAGQAGADPHPVPAPSDPGVTAPVPGQPVVEPLDGPVAPPAPPPVGEPPVPEIPNQVYGQGQSPGRFGYLRDLWHTFHSGNPLESITAPPPDGAPGPPPGAGPPPPLPPGYTSLNAPESSTPALPKGPDQGGPALPPGYYPLNGPPPPGYYDGPPTGPESAAPPMIEPIPPTP